MTPSKKRSRPKPTKRTVVHTDVKPHAHWPGDEIDLSLDRQRALEAQYGIPSLMHARTKDLPPECKAFRQAYMRNRKRAQRTRAAPNETTRVRGEIMKDMEWGHRRERALASELGGSREIVQAQKDMGNEVSKAWHNPGRRWSEQKKLEFCMMDPTTEELDTIANAVIESTVGGADAMAGEFVAFDVRRELGSISLSTGLTGMQLQPSSQQIADVFAKASQGYTPEEAVAFAKFAREYAELDYSCYGIRKRAPGVPRPAEVGRIVRLLARPEVMGVVIDVSDGTGSTKAAFTPGTPTFQVYRLDTLSRAWWRQDWCEGWTAPSQV